MEWYPERIYYDLYTFRLNTLVDTSNTPLTRWGDSRRRIGWVQRARPIIIEDSPAGDLPVTNHDSQHHTIHVLLLDDGEPVYWASQQATPAKGGPMGGARLEEFPRQPGNYVLHVRVDSQAEYKPEPLDFNEYDDSCIGITIPIGDTNQTDLGDVSIWKTTNPHEREDEKFAHQ